MINFLFNIKTKTRTRSTARAGLLLIAALLCLSVYQPGTASATMVGWDAGRIIDDGVFTNPNSMSANSIQTFLNSKVPICDTNGQQLSEYGGSDLNGDGKVQRWEWGKERYNQSTFICLKDYVEDGKKASQIIYDKAQAYRINPQVLLVLLQKEQGLIGDTWPLNVQYRTATGYGCPDTAPCDSQYYGLTNQLDWAATMFRSIMDASPTWYTPYLVGNNYIQYNPNADCGGSNVYIVNRATQALYNYTPYQPNDYALNGGGSSAYPYCGAFGNRNFYNYYTDWFGSTSDYEPLLRPRHMILKADIQKTDLVSLDKVGGSIAAGQLIKFTSKTTINGVTYVRTEFDTTHGRSYGFAVSELREVPSYQPLAQLRHMILNSDVQKTNMISLQKDGSLGTSGQTIYFTSKTTINGITYVRTEYDTIRGNSFGFAVSELREVPLYQPLMRPRNMVLKADTQKTSLISLQKDGSLGTSGQTIYFTSKTTINGVAYVRTDFDTTRNKDFGFAVTELEEAL